MIAEIKVRRNIKNCLSKVLEKMKEDGIQGTQRGFHLSWEMGSFILSQKEKRRGGGSTNISRFVITM